MFLPAGGSHHEESRHGVWSRKFNLYINWENFSKALFVFHFNRDHLELRHHGFPNCSRREFTYDKDILIMRDGIAEKGGPSEGSKIILPEASGK